jgi:hypothetical protein
MSGQSLLRYTIVRREITLYSRILSNAYDFELET